MQCREAGLAERRLTALDGVLAAVACIAPSQLGLGSAPLGDLFAHVDDPELARWIKKLRKQKKVAALAKILAQARASAPSRDDGDGA